MNEIDKLTEYFTHFPGVAIRQARRFVYYLLSRDPGVRKSLARLIEEVGRNVHQCTLCGRFSSEQKDEKSGQMRQMLRQQFIRVGGARGDFVNVVDGLKAGDLVVTSGVFKLRPGAHVVIDNTLAPDAQLDPKPKNS